jgi:hypothetical protein
MSRHPRVAARWLLRISKNATTRRSILGQVSGGGAIRGTQPLGALMRKLGRD